MFLSLYLSLCAGCLSTYVLSSDDQSVFIVESGVLDLHHQVALPRLGLHRGGGGQVGPGEGLHRGGGLAPGDQGREGGEKAR